jgi:hypothetical protein
MKSAFAQHFFASLLSSLLFLAAMSFASPQHDGKSISPPRKRLITTAEVRVDLVQVLTSASNSFGRSAPTEQHANTHVSQADLLIISFPAGGFYLVSLPMAVQDSSVSVLFPMALGAFSWERDHYETISTMTRGKGYWLAIPGPSTAVISGTPIKQFQRHFLPGWNLIGSVMDSVDFSNPNDIPDGSVFLPAFRWDTAAQRYLPTMTIEQSYGQWIAVTQECDIIVQGRSSTTLAKALEQTPPPFAKSQGLAQHTTTTSSWTIPVTITLSGGGQDAVKFGTRTGATNSLDAGVDVLNPPPPPGGVDAYFEITHQFFPRVAEDYRSTQDDSITWKLIINGSGGQSGKITWDASSFPVGNPATAVLQIKQGNTVLANMLTQDSLNFTGDQSLQIVCFSTAKTAVESPAEKSLPKSFQIKNYPNPFRDATTIEISMPQALPLEARLFNLLGQEIRSFRLQPNASGRLTIQWDGRDAQGDPVPGGIYFYRVEVQGASVWKKLYRVR